MLRKCFGWFCRKVGCRKSPSGVDDCTLALSTCCGQGTHVVGQPCVNQPVVAFVLG